MKYSELVEASIVANIKSDIKNALIALKIQGIDQIETSQVLDDFTNRGTAISYEELVNFIGNDPMISNINKKFITFSGTSDEPEVASLAKIDVDKLKVQKMANTALKKRI